MAEDWNKRIEPLIEDVERRCKKRALTPYKTVSFFLIMIFYITAIVFLIIELTVVLSSYGSYIATLKTSQEATTFLTNQEAGYAALSVAIIAIVVSLFPTIISFPKTTAKELSDWYFEGDYFHTGLSSGRSERDRPYLKALINLKCAEFNVNIAHLFHSNPELFTQVSLLKLLFE